jgi:hypothetical protein
MTRSSEDRGGASMSEPMTLADAVDALLAAADAAYTSHVGGVTYVPVQAIEELRSAQRAPLDVERLARAIGIVSPSPLPPLYWTDLRLAQAIAREYAAVRGEE